MTRPLEKLSAWVLGQIGRRLWGFAPVLMPRIVERMGPVGALRWMGRNMPVYERILKDMGPIRCHLACVTASLLNGCAYCAYGHARPIQLYYFRDRGALFPLDEHGLIALSQVEDQEMSSRLEQVLEAAGMREEIALVRRLHALKFDGAVPESEEAGAWRISSICSTCSTPAGSTGLSHGMTPMIPSSGTRSCRTATPRPGSKRVRAASEPAVFEEAHRIPWKSATLLRPESGSGGEPPCHPPALRTPA